jgi:Fungal N-terminal domain of STAND proteins
MDPLSVSASIIAVVTLAATSSKEFCTLVGAIRGAPAAINAIANDARAFNQIVRSLESALKEPEVHKYVVADSTLREQVNNLAEPLRNCSATFRLLMTKLQAHIKPDGQGGRWRFATTAGLKWYLGKKDIMESVDRLADNRATVDVWLSAITLYGSIFIKYRQSMS